MNESRHEGTKARGHEGRTAGIMPTANCQEPRANSQQPTATRQWHWVSLFVAATLCVLCGFLTTGCAGVKLIGAMAQNYEYQKQIEVLPEYSGLENKTVAVVVDADYSTLFDHPDLVFLVMSGVSARLNRDVPGIRVLPAQLSYTWQYNTPSWNAMPYGEIAEELNVDRVVYVDIYEYRLNPPGNRWEWEGMAAANIGVVERGGLAPDSFVSTHHVAAKFPDKPGIDRDSADARVIEEGLLREFVKRTAWIFHEHLEPKYPDKYLGAK